MKKQRFTHYEPTWEWQSNEEIKKDKNKPRVKRRLKRTLKQFKEIINQYFENALGYESPKSKIKKKEGTEKNPIFLVKRGEILPKEMLYINLSINSDWINKYITSPSKINVIRYYDYREYFNQALELLKGILFKQALNNNQSFAAIKWYLNVAFNIKEDVSNVPNQPIILHFKGTKKEKSVVSFNNNLNEFAIKHKKREV